jgi:hypothetical protein
MNRFLAEIHALDGTVDSVELRHDAPHEEGSSSAHEGWVVYHLPTGVEPPI